MKTKKKICVLASGNGSNLQVLLDEAGQGKLPVEIALVFSDQPQAYALKRSKKAGVRVATLLPKDFSSRKAFDQAVVGLLKNHEIEVLVLAGYMRILSKSFVRAFWGHIVNIHPALLPAYPGTHAIERAYWAGEPEIGVTVHFVDEGVDTGPVIVQEVVPIDRRESLETLTQRVHALEHRLLPQALRSVVQGDVVFSEARE